MKTILVIMILWVILLSDFNISLQLGNKKYELKYNGLVWVGLDYFTIMKYNSQDKPMKFLQFSCKIV